MQHTVDLHRDSSSSYGVSSEEPPIVLRGTATSAVPPFLQNASTNMIGTNVCTCTLQIAPPPAALNRIDAGSCTNAMKIGETSKADAAFLQTYI